MDSSGIPCEKIPQGISMCYENAKRLLDAATAYKSRFLGPGPLPTELYREIKYGSCCGLAILALEEVGKGLFLLKKYQRHENVTSNAWREFAYSHQRKIEKAIELLSLTKNEKTQLNEIKKRDIYVDWKDNDWQSPNDPKVEEQKITDIFSWAEKALQAFGERLDKEKIERDPWLQEYLGDLERRGLKL